MALEIESRYRRPVVDADAFVAPTAVLVGDVTVAAGASIWYGAVLRADFGTDRGRRRQQRAGQLRRARRRGPADPGGRGDRRPPGHHGRLRDRARRPDRDGRGDPAARPRRQGGGDRRRQRGRRGRADPPGVLAAGAPAQVKGELSDRARQWGRTAAREYQRLVSGTWPRPGSSAEEARCRQSSTRTTTAAPLSPAAQPVNGPTPPSARVLARWAFCTSRNRSGRYSPTHWPSPGPRRPQGPVLAGGPSGSAGVAHPAPGWLPGPRRHPSLAEQDRGHGHHRPVRQLLPEWST